MARRKVFDLARMTTASTGSGTSAIVLGAAVSGYLGFAAAGVSDGDLVTYTIRDGANSEIQEDQTYTASGTTLTRGTPRSSTNGGSRIALSGSAQVFISATARDFSVFYGMDYYVGAQATGPKVAYVGDSRTVGFGASTPYPTLVTAPTWNTQSFTGTNVAVNGQTLKTMGRTAFSAINPIYANEGGMNIAVVWGGYNDFTVDGAAADVAFAYLSEFCRRLRSQGWRIVVCTEISANGADAFKNTFNGYIRTRWPTFADMIADIGADTNIGADGAYLNSTYFQADGVHPKNAGLAIVATAVQAALGKIAVSGAYVGVWPFNNAYAMFGHAALDHTVVGNYAIIQQNDGSTFFNAAASKRISFLIGAQQAANVDLNGSWVFGPAATANASAKVQIDSTTKGVLLPRMTTTQRDAISSPGEGLLIYNTTAHVLNFWNGSAWGAV